MDETSSQSFSQQDAQSGTENYQLNVETQDEHVRVDKSVGEEQKSLVGQSQIPVEEQVQVPPVKAKKKGGPIQPERRSKRIPEDGVPVLEKAKV
jgi:hypothetical protein